MEGVQALKPVAENTAKIQRGRPFKPGTSGNPKGRPKGSRSKSTLALEELLDGEAEAITRKIVEKAKEGDTAAMRFCLDRLLPPRRERPVEFDLPPIETAADAARAAAAVLEACAGGNLSPSEAARVMDLISTYVRMLEAVGPKAKDNPAPDPDYDPLAEAVENFERTLKEQGL
jgi:Family of unknown function (DUF5681)